MKAVMRKLRNNVGTSLAEVLVTVLLLSIMGLALTVGVTTVHRTYSQIVRKANEQTLLSTTLIEMRNAIRRSVDYDTARGRFKSEEGYWFSFENAGAGEKGIQIAYYMEADGAKVESIPVVSEADGKISDVYSSFTSVTPAAGKDGIFVISGLEVGNGKDVPTKLDSYKVRQIIKGGSE